MERETFICDLGSGMLSIIKLDPARLKPDEGFLPVEFRGRGGLDACQYQNLVIWLHDVLGTVSSQFRRKVWCITAVASDYRWCETLTAYPSGRCECKMVQAGELLKI